MACASGLHEVSEDVRETETFRYDTALIENAIRIPLSGEVPSSAHLKSCPDTALTAFAALGASRLRASRAIISLFDSQYQYIVAEATPTSQLKPGISGDEEDDRLWLCGTALPRELGLCQAVLGLPCSSLNNVPQNDGHPLPVLVIDDLASQPAPPVRLCCNLPSDNRFYAGVPIQTARGINIGVFCIFDTQPRDGLNSASVDLMRDLASIIMGYLESRRCVGGHRRVDRMLRGIGRFVEANPTVSSSEKGNIGDTPPPDGRDGEDPLSGYHKWFEPLDGQGPPESPEPIDSPTLVTDPGSSAAELKGFSGTHDDHASSRSNPSPSNLNSVEEDVGDMILKAAEILRQSTETDGVVFLGAKTSSSSDRLLGKGFLNAPDTQSSNSNNSAFLPVNKAEGCPNVATEEDCGPRCRILGYSNFPLATAATPSRSSHSDLIHSDGPSIPESLLERMLQRFPTGAVFNFNSGRGSCKYEVFRGVSHNREFSQPTQFFPGPIVSRDLEVLAAAFHDARSVLFFPIWDPHEQRWFAGGFAYLLSKNRTFSIEGDVSYLTVFGAAIMGQVLRCRAAKVEKSKRDVLGSLSHEFRSPLHGVILGTELLLDTPLTVQQGDLLYTIEACSRTLLDTIDHLLDWSKINSFGDNSTGRRRSTDKTNKRGSIMSITSDINLVTLTEEVIEAIFVGHCLQQRATGQDKSHQDIVASLGGLHVAETLPGLRDTQQVAIGDVTVNLNVSSDTGWAFHTQPGAIRRIIMNLVGNSLKYTTQGFITLSLRQAPSPSTILAEESVSEIELIVTDSGCGISKEYLENDVFVPFQQENILTPGTGIGLPMVKRVVKALGGALIIRSEVGKGTAVTVRLPLAPTKTNLAPEQTQAAKLDASITDKTLSGLRVRLLGFSTKSGKSVFGIQADELGNLTTICQDWLGLHVLNPTESKSLSADIVIYHERHLSETVQTQARDDATPIIVICHNPLSASQRAANYRELSMDSEGGLAEFVSQPVGPRKLAGILSLMFHRWASLQTTQPYSQNGDFHAQTNLTLTKHGSSLDTSTNLLIKNHLPPRAVSSPSLSTASSPNPFDIPPIEGNGPKFLLVEDNPINLKILMTYMKKLGQEFETACNGQEAVDKFSQGVGKFKCVFMDISMPVMDGFQASRHIRAFEVERNLRPCMLLALTGLASADAHQEAFASGIDVFLTKPVKLVELSQILVASGIKIH